MSEAVVYRCSSCGAPADPKARECAFCRAAIHAVRCPWCFDWSDAGVEECPRCHAASAAPPAGAKPLSCPTCRGKALFTRVLDGAYLSGCADCGGVWADAASFRRICENRETRSAYMGQGAALAAPGVSDPSKHEIRYRPCAQCGELMNRFNFAGCSGVVLDVCKPHGVWFDADELRAIVAFISGGGLDVARGKQIQELELERERLERAQHDREGASPIGYRVSVSHVTSASGLLEHLLGLDG